MMMRRVYSRLILPYSTIFSDFVSRLVMRAICFLSSVQNPEEPLRCEQGMLAEYAETAIHNDFDLIAVEKAVQLKENGMIDEVVLFSMAPESSILQRALAIGADRAVYAAARNCDLTPEIVVDTALASIEADDETIWITGKLGVNFESHRTAQILAMRLGVPCLCSAFNIERSGDEWEVACEHDFGTPVYRVRAPFVVTADLRLADPRYPGLPSLLKAKRKPVVQADAVSGYSGEHGCVEAVQEKRRQCEFIEPSAVIEMLRG